MNKDAFWLWMSENFGFASNRNTAVLKFYGFPDGILSLSDEEIMEENFFNERQKQELIRKDFKKQEEKIADMRKRGIHVISISNKYYPPLLRNIENPPFILYCAGNLNALLHSYPITMVGTRHPDSYGIKSASDIAYELSSMGALIISGLAGGCDRICHQGALNAGGPTIGITACGLNVDYPKGTREFKREICRKGGAVITEFPPSYPVRSENFAIRNRILSGMSLGTVIIQGKLRSGTMLTANYAAEQGKEIFALTGDAFNPLTEGPLSLLKDGAEPFTKSEDIMKHFAEIYKKPLYFPKNKRENIIDSIELNEKPKRTAKEEKSRIKPEKAKREEIKEENTPKQYKDIPDNLSEDEKKIISALREGAMNIDTLCLKTELPSHRLLAILTGLEIISLVNALPGGKYEAL